MNKVRRICATLISIFMLVCSLSFNNSAQTTKANLSVGTIDLLPGYQHKREQGIDTIVGHIWKEGGITISYDIGKLAGIYVLPDQKTQFKWYKEQKINNQTVRIAMTKERQLRVTFVETNANFVGVVPTEQDLTDALLMLLTFRHK
jgi:hypothetical protein